MDDSNNKNTIVLNLRWLLDNTTLHGKDVSSWFN